MDLYLVVWGYVGIYRRKEYVGGASGGPRGRGAHPGGAPSTLVTAFGTSWSRFQVSRDAFLPKTSSVKFHVNWTPFDFPFLRNTEIGKKTAIWARPPVNRLVPKII